MPDSCDKSSTLDFPKFSGGPVFCLVDCQLDRFTFTVRLNLDPVGPLQLCGWEKTVHPVLSRREFIQVKADRSQLLQSLVNGRPVRLIARGSVQAELLRRRKFQLERDRVANGNRSLWLIIALRADHRRSRRRRHGADGDRLRGLGLPVWPGLLNDRLLLRIRSHRVCRSEVLERHDRRTADHGGTPRRASARAAAPRHDSQQPECADHRDTEQKRFLAHVRVLIIPRRFEGVLPSTTNERPHSSGPMPGKEQDSRRKGELHKLQAHGYNYNS